MVQRQGELDSNNPWAMSLANKFFTNVRNERIDMQLSDDGQSPASARVTLFAKGYHFNVNRQLLFDKCYQKCSTSQPSGKLFLAWREMRSWSTLS
jgi:hypothetical protein